MEKELNIAEILKEKPLGIKLWTDAFGEVTLDYVSKNGNGFNVKHHHGVLDKFLSNGKIYEEGTLCIYPSKSMRDWSKFAWKKGDVLKVEIGSSGCSCIFDRFTNDDYTEFTGVFDKYLDRFDSFATSDWCKVTDEKEYESIIQRIETQYGGKLNLDTLRIGKPQFKDGDIIAIVSLKKYVCVAIYQMHQEQNVAFHAVLCNNGELLLEEPFREDDGDIEIRPATEDEKQQLFDALAKENKAWDAEKKAIVDLPKKCEFKAFDKVLVRDTKDECWRPAFFASLDEDIINEYCYCLIGDPDGVFCKYCIPYNEDTSHLLGTTDDWKGGEG